MNIQYRLAEKSDREFARSLHHQVYHDVVVEQFGAWNERVQDGYFSKGWRIGESTIILLDGQAVGCLRCERHKEYLQLVELQVALEYQGRGIGSKVLEDQIALANSLGLALRLQVLKKNRAQALYLRYGFQKYNESETHFLMERELGRSP